LQRRDGPPAVGRSVEMKTADLSGHNPAPFAKL